MSTCGSGQVLLVSIDKHFGISKLVGVEKIVKVFLACLDAIAIARIDHKDKCV